MAIQWPKFQVDWVFRHIACINAEVSGRLGVSAHSLYKWVKAVKPDKADQQNKELVEAKSEVLRLRAQLRRTEEERDILKKAARYFASQPE